MIKRLKNLAIVMLSAMLMIGLVACGEKKEAVDYGNAKCFETALNNGEDLTGKIVQFKVSEVEPNSAFGYNIMAGEHLNFISSKNPNVKAGNTTTVKVSKIQSTLGSWLISYKFVNAEITKKTITSVEAKKDKDTDTEDKEKNDGKTTDKEKTEDKSASTDFVADYADAASFEAELNNGADLTGKTVSIKVDKLDPSSAYGYDIWAGEHLNFVSSTNPNVSEGDVINVKATSIKNIADSWIIQYQMVQ
ncbi:MULTISPECIES: hypothetical protein [unclassified Bilifractor]|uniref:hypothetical protein n=1 Tax=unclassified Bilifractor TaxID=2815795 RepID=UPI003F8F7C24